MTAEAVMEKVRKLLALATSDNVHEAANAAAAAQRLMADHKLEAADVEAETGKVDDEPVIEAVLVEDGRALVGWRAMLIGVIAGANGCTHIFSWKKQEPPVRCFKVIGRSSEAQAATYLFQYLVNEINRLCARDGKGQGKAFANSFRHGAVRTISERLFAAKTVREREFHAAAAAGEKRSSVAIAVINRDKEAIDTFVKQAYPKLRTARIGGTSNIDGYDAGQRAAQSINLPGKDRELGAAPRQIKGQV